MKPRYGRVHHSRKVSFFLSDFTLNLEQSKFLLLKVVEQAIKDYCYLDPSQLKEDSLSSWKTARDFIFLDGYTIDWGEDVYDFSMICQYLGLNPEWIQLKTKQKLKKQLKKTKRNISDYERTTY